MHAMLSVIILQLQGHNLASIHLASDCNDKDS